MRPARFGYADTPLGQLHYVEQGEGPPVLLLHQTPRSHDEFRELLPLLAAGHRAIAMDMPTFGRSATCPPPHTIEHFAVGALALLDALSVHGAAVLGHHTGGAVAIEMAASAPERVSALVLSSTPYTDPSYRASHAAGPSVDVVDPTEDGSHLLALWEQRRPYYPAPSAPLLDRFVHDALAPGVDPAEGHQACARYRMEDRIPLVEAPVLLLGAEADPFALPALERLAAALPTLPRTAVIAGGTIPLMEQKAAEVAAEVLPFLGSPQQITTV
ncbi:alpha/beta fold hydrolase [Pseudonocardia spinosispora]|uniref:alpha/beta fold hydrolase n=1 Tax=Pseudonocardia spinosispora TaxID=103441 RepID=UPI0004214ADF|nr:alpha/beta hydrolase [Pseudonocardia spinosispora]